MNSETTPPTFRTPLDLALQPFDPWTHVPRAGKSTIMNDLMADMLRKSKNQETCGPLGGGMTALLRAMEEHYVAAGGSLMVIDKGPSMRGMHTQTWSAANRIDRLPR